MGTFYDIKRMKIGVIGLGSMGRRRIRLLIDLVNPLNIFGYDISRERGIKVQEEYGIQLVDSIDEIVQNNSIDSVFICSSPMSHSKIAIECLKNRKNIFSELNLIKDGYKEIIELSSQNNKIAFLSSTFLYRKEIQWIKKRIDNKDKYQYNYQVGQYLPDWHPWESYKNFFVHDKRTNGLRELMAIEFPWIIDIFGKIKVQKNLKTKISDLEIDYPDSINIIIEHENGSLGNINFNIIKRKAERKLEIMNDLILISWNGNPDTLQDYDIHDESFNKIKLYEDIIKDSDKPNFIVENAYKDEIITFLNSVIDGKNYGLHDYQRDLYILDLIDEIEAMG